MDDDDDDGRAEGVRQLAARELDAPGEIVDPIPIVGPDGRHERWFVPAVAGDLLVGFFVIGLDLVVHRWSAFQQAIPAADWLDEATIADRARAVVPEGELGRPRLSYDGAPDRLAWAVPAGDRIIYVAGASAWTA